MNSAGQKLVDTTSSDESKVACFAHRGKKGTTLWIANLTAQNQKVNIGGANGALVGTTLDESTFGVATTKPIEFQSKWKAMGKNLTLTPYAVAIISVAD